MPKTKVIYFPIKALAEPIRFLLSYMGEDFEDYRFEMEQWPTIKPNMPFGKVPVLEMDGKMLHQSTAICRYLGKKAGLAGSDDFENLQIDIAVDTFHDFRQEISKYWYESDEGLKAKKKEVLFNETMPYWLPKFDQLVKDNGGYLANGKLSWGDLYFVGVNDYLMYILGADYLDKYTNLKQLINKVLEVPKIKEWVAKRPKTDM